MLRSEIVGSIKMRVFLSGMPELRLGLNDKVLFDNTGREYPRQPTASLGPERAHAGLRAERGHVYLECLLQKRVHVITR